MNYLHNDEIVLIQVLLLIKSQSVYRGYCIRKIIKYAREEYLELAKSIDKDNIPTFKNSLACLPSFSDSNKPNFTHFQHNLTKSSVNNISIKPTPIQNSPTQSKEEIWGIITLLFFNLKQQIDEKKNQKL